MSLSTALLFAVAVSLDGLGAGIAYGLKRICMPLPALFVIGGVTIIMMGLAVCAAAYVGGFISPGPACILGAMLLIGLGVWSIFQEWVKQCLPDCDEKSVISPAQLRFNIGVFHLVVQVFKQPTEADVDHSGELSCLEALILGMALALDALVAGFGAALAGGIPFWAVILVGVVQTFFIIIGAWLAKNHMASSLQKKFTYLPGSIFILIGLLRFL